MNVRRWLLRPKRNKNKCPSAEGQSVFAEGFFVIEFDPTVADRGSTSCNRRSAWHIVGMEFPLHTPAV
jgi:hypothetical protein